MKLEIAFSKLNNGSLGAFVGHTLQTINQSNEPELIGHDKVVTLISTYEVYQESLSKRVYNLYTQDLSRSFESVNTAFVSFKRHVNFLLYSTDAEEVQIAELIRKHLGSLDRSWSRLRISQQSPYIHNILNEFGKLQYSVIMSKTNLSKKLAGMQTAIEAYDVVLANNVNDKNSMKAIASACSLRGKLIEDYTTVYSYVYGLSTTTDDAKWKLMIEQFYQFYLSELANQRSKSSSDDSSDSSSTDKTSDNSDTTK
ncbi:MAG: DUF6261 family protein [Bacteroidota bacterium]|nr:DUF6261 family protein [Bacteroidota bacterium]